MHRSYGGFSSVCIQVEPGRSKMNEILEITVLEKFSQQEPIDLSENKLKTKNYTLWLWLYGNDFIERAALVYRHT